MLSRWGHLYHPLIDKDVIPIAECSTVNERCLKDNRLRIINGLENAELRKMTKTNTKESEVMEDFAAAPAMEIVKTVFRETDGIQEYYS